MIVNLDAEVLLETDQERKLKKGLLGMSGLLTDQSNNVIFL